MTSPVQISAGVLFSATAQPDKARVFYGEVLGLELSMDTPFALVFNVNGQQLRVQKVEKVVSPPYTTLGLEVEDLAECISGMVARGVQFNRYEFLDQDEQGIWATPDGARIAWCNDPDDNVISFTQSA